MGGKTCLDHLLFREVLAALISFLLSQPHRMFLERDVHKLTVLPHTMVCKTQRDRAATPIHPILGRMQPREWKG